VGFGVRDGKFYVARARAVLLSSGGAAGLWRPANHGDAHHRMWYFPFNTGASYAMCKRAGCEMTGFDNRLVTVRTKDTYSPTGTLQIGMGAPMVNARGEAFMRDYPEYIKWGGHTAPTQIRLLGFCKETENSRGPIYIDTSKGDPFKVAGLKSQYLDMSPSLVLYWGCNDINPSKEPVEIDAADPAVVGSHAGMSGAWTPKEDRMTTLPGLFVSGDALGGAPSRFISGTWTCGRIAARNCIEWIKNHPDLAELDPAEIDAQEELSFRPAKHFEELAKSGFWTDGTLKEGINPKQMEDRMQRIMEDYCGGRTQRFNVSEPYLKVARKLLERLRKTQLQYLTAKDLHELQLAWDVLNRLDVCQLVVEHISHRKETRYPGAINRTDYPDCSDEYDGFINSVWNPATDELTFYKRPYVQIVPGDRRKQTI
jgi:adenylylsulfate reductase subunit A